jgi:hypothetical protein
MADESKDVFNERTPIAPLSQAQTQFARTLAKALAERWINQTNRNVSRPVTQMTPR